MPLNPATPFFTREKKIKHVGDEINFRQVTKSDDIKKTV